jgi:hypothetical protein
VVPGVWHISCRKIDIATIRKKRAGAVIPASAVRAEPLVLQSGGDGHAADT